MHVLLVGVQVVALRPGGTAGGGISAASVPRDLSLLLHPLLEVHLRVPLLLVAARELPTADVAGEGLLARMRSDVRREVVRPAEGPHADPALEGLLARVYPYVPGELVGPAEPPVAVLDRAGVRPFVDGRLARPVRVLSRLDRHELERHRRLLVHLREDFVPLARRRVVFGELHARVPAARRLLLAAGRAAAVRLLLRHEGGRAGHGEAGRAARASVLLHLRVDPLVLAGRAGDERLPGAAVHELLLLLLLLLAHVHVHR